MGKKNRRGGLAGFGSMPILYSPAAVAAWKQGEASLASGYHKMAMMRQAPRTVSRLMGFGRLGDAGGAVAAHVQSAQSAAQDFIDARKAVSQAAYLEIGHRHALRAALLRNQAQAAGARDDYAKALQLEGQASNSDQMASRYNGMANQVANTVFTAHLGALGHDMGHVMGQFGYRLSQHRGNPSVAASLEGLGSVQGAWMSSLAAYGGGAVGQAFAAIEYGQRGVAKKAVCRLFGLGDDASDLADEEGTSDSGDSSSSFVGPPAPIVGPPAPSSTSDSSGETAQEQADDAAADSIYDKAIAQGQTPAQAQAASDAYNSARENGQSAAQAQAAANAVITGNGGSAVAVGGSGGSGAGAGTSAAGAAAAGAAAGGGINWTSLLQSAAGAAQAVAQTAKSVIGAAAPKTGPQRNPMFAANSDSDIVSYYVAAKLNRAPVAGDATFTAASSTGLPSNWTLAQVTANVGAITTEVAARNLTAQATAAYNAANTLWNRIKTASPLLLAAGAVGVGGGVYLITHRPHEGG